MPIFDFKCIKCDRQEEVLIFDSSDPVVCPICKKAMIKLIGAPATIFKGDGFYKEGFTK